jgi:hypothetical protein
VSEGWVRLERVEKCRGGGWEGLRVGEVLVWGRGGFFNFPLDGGGRNMV